jgi:ketopantoate reductase
MLFGRCSPTIRYGRGVSYISAAVREPGVIRHVGPIQNLVFGEFDGQRSERALGLLEACEGAGIGARISDQIEREIWDKFAALMLIRGRVVQWHPMRTSDRRGCRQSSRERPCSFWRK